ncbi:MAG: hypothetical protein NVS9B2_03670 [Steroidobacteraceae bacterium]
MSEQSAAISGRAPVETSSNRSQRRIARPAEYWASRTLWLLVMLTILWDITVTFDRYFYLARRLFYACLAH